jgi:hypothetical protein
LERTGDFSTRSDNVNRDTTDWRRGGDQGEFERRGANIAASGYDDPSVGMGSTGVPGNTTTAETIGLPSDNRGPAGYGSHERDTDFDYSHSAESKPGMGQRMMGSMEKTMGKMTGNQERVERGEERKVSYYIKYPHFYMSSSFINRPVKRQIDSDSSEKKCSS